MISVLIPTRNEEQDLPACLASVNWSDDVHIYDCYSTDRTLDIARWHGAHVTQREYDPALGAFGGNEASHKNWALDNIAFKYPWVLHIDADERVTPELCIAARAAVADPGDCVAFSIRRRDFFMGTWLKHVQASPYYLRLFRADKMRYERVINPLSIPDGPVRTLDGYLDHFPFSKGITHWLNRHNTYSSLEAQQIALNRTSQDEFRLSLAIFGKDFHQRRFHQKELFYRLPARPLTKFILLYLIKRGFMDGHAGFTYATLQAIYEYMIVLKSDELRQHAALEPALPG